MISPLLATMQSSIMQRNNAQMRMMQCSDAMMSSIGCQPLSPSFGNQMELQMKADETKVTVLQKMMEAIEKAMAKNIERSTPKYGGLDCKA